MVFPRYYGTPTLASLYTSIRSPFRLSIAAFTTFSPHIYFVQIFIDDFLWTIFFGEYINVIPFRFQ